MTHALDLETSSLDGDFSNGHALEPWRVRQGKAFISSLHVHGDKHQIHILRPTREQLIEVLQRLKGEEVYAHYALFDVAWLISSIEPNKMARVPQCVMEVRWRDTALLAKWCTNGRRADDMRLSYSLLNMINVFKTQMGYEGADDFIRMKQAEVRNASDPYWEERGKQDVLWTWRFAKFMGGAAPGRVSAGVHHRTAIHRYGGQQLVDRDVRQ
jgi:hypothetical protein